MRNLKRVLTMIMAVAMLMSLMVVGAGAAFPDQDEIKHADAVQKMVSLNIIEGRDDGSFDPTAIVTRAEMAKMICVALNGGNDPKLSSGTVVSFTDTKGHWAEGYIEYCVNLGIVNGLGDGTFGPDQGVTATQAAKMLLVALGYDAEYEKFVGLTWALQVNKIAMQKGLYEDIMGIDANAPMSRDDAAQMLSNFTTSKLVRYELGIGGGGNDIVGIKQAYDTDETVLSKYFKLVELDGQLTQIGYDEKKAEHTYQVSYTDKGGNSANETFYSENDYSALFGANVTVLWRNKDNSTNATTGDPTYTSTADAVYDIILRDSSIVATGVMDDFGKYDATKNTLEFADVTYDTEKTSNKLPALKAFSGNASGTTVEVVNGSDDKAVIKEGSSNISGAYNVSLLDNDNDGKVDLVVYQPFTVAKVTYAGSTSTTFSALSDGTSIGNKENDKVVLYDGIAKDDIVAYYAAANTTMDKDTVVKLDVQTGTISGVKDNNKYLIDGTWYTKDSRVTVNLSVNDNIEYVAVGSVIYYAKVVEHGSTSKNLLTVYDAEQVQGVGKGYEALVMLENGEKKTVVLEKVDGKDITGTNATEQDGKVVLGKLYTYKVNSDNRYELTSLDATNNTAGYDFYDTDNSGLVANSKKLAGRDIADDARIFVVDTKNKAMEQFTGKEIKNYSKGITGTVEVLGNKVNGYETVQVATIYGTSATPPTNIQGSNYGYLTVDAYASTGEDGTNYVNYTIWNGTEEVTVKEKNTATTNLLKAGKVITFDKAGDGLVKNVADAAGNIAALTGFQGEAAKPSKVTIDQKGSFEIDSDDTTILYVNTKDKKGAEGGEIQLATETATDTYTNNVYYIDNGSSMLKLLVVDINNKYEGAKGDQSTIDAGNTDAIQDALDNGGNVTVTGSEMTGTLNVPANASLTFADNATVSGNVTVQGSMTAEENTSLAVNNTVTVADGGTFDAFNTKLSGTGTIKVEKGGTMKMNANYNGGTDSMLPTITKLDIAAGGTLKSMTTNEPENTETIFVGPTADARIQTADTTTVSLNLSSNPTMTVNGDITIPAGKTWYTMFDSATEAKGIAMTQASGTLTVNGELAVASANKTGSSLTVADGANVVVNGTVTISKYGNVTLAANAKMTVNANATLADSNDKLKGTDTTSVLDLKANSNITVGSSSLTAGKTYTWNTSAWTEQGTP